MVQGDGTYCFQTRIDIRVCEACVPGAAHLRARYDLLMEVLRGAAMLLSPSEAHRQLYLAQGLAPERIFVTPNGVRHPAAPPAARPLTPGRLTFAYVGGNVDVKGFRIVRQVFESLSRPDWRLVMVDNTINLGFSSIDASHWRVRGEIEIVPAYTQATMDAFFAGIDVLVFPSQWKESFGLTVREALLRGVWVIATEGGGPAEAVADGVNGTLIPLDGKPDGLLAAVEALLEDPGRLAHAPSPAGIIDFAAQAEQLHKILIRAALP
jgi:glycosyltransferase involved in cell wall biosynthesis